MRWKIASWPRQGPSNFIGYSLSSDIIGLDGLAFPDSPFKYISTVNRHNHFRNTSSKEEVGIRKYEIRNWKAEIENQKSEIKNQNQNSESEFGSRNLECRNFGNRNWNLSYEFEIRFHVYVNYFNLVLTSINVNVAMVIL
jgi:hypothetical protein